MGINIKTDSVEAVLMPIILRAVEIGKHEAEKAAIALVKEIIEREIETSVKSCVSEISNSTNVHLEVTIVKKNGESDGN